MANTNTGIRIYADTSVFGGVFDHEFSTASKTFFDQVFQGRFRLVLSSVVQDEIEPASQVVKDLFNDSRVVSEIIDVTDESIRLQQAYLRAGIVGPRWESDALHVALATVSGCRIIVSWNFRHIVSFQKIPLYNGINLSKGYNPIAIHTPLEVIGDDN